MVGLFKIIVILYVDCGYKVIGLWLNYIKIMVIKFIIMLKLCKIIVEL